MKARTLVVLGIVFCLLGAAALYAVRGGGSAGRTRMGEPLFSDLPVNAIARIHLSGPGGEVRLKKGPSVWEVENRFGYPADFGKISELVKKVRDLKVGRTFSSDPAIRERLALVDPLAADGKNAENRGTRVTLLPAAAGDPPVADLLIGKDWQGAGPTGGHHLMRMGPATDESVYVVDQSLRFLEADPEAWLERELVDRAPEEVRQVDCYDLGSGKLLYRLVRAGKGGPPALEGQGEKEVTDPAKIERLFEALSGLTIDGVAGTREAVDFAGLQSPRRLEYRLFDGGVYTLHTGKRGGDGQDVNYLAVEAAYDPPADSGGEDAPAAGDAASGKDRGAPGPDTGAEIKRLQERLAPWVYTVATWKSEGLVSDREGLLQPRG